MDCPFLGELFSIALFVQYASVSVCDNSLVHHYCCHRSLQHVDLRLCYSNNITRTVLEADMSYFNGYQVGLAYLCVCV